MSAATTNIRFYAGVPIGGGNQLTWSSESTRDNYFDTTWQVGSTLQGYTNVLIFTGTCKLQGTAGSLGLANVNYIAIDGNPDNGQAKRIYGKVSGWIQENNNTININFDIDWWTTYCKQAEFKPCLVLREHPTVSEWDKMNASRGNYNFSLLDSSDSALRLMRTGEDLEPDFKFDNAFSFPNYNSTEAAGCWLTGTGNNFYLLYTTNWSDSQIAEVRSDLSGRGIDLNVVTPNIVHAEGVDTVAITTPQTIFGIDADRIQDALTVISTRNLGETILGIYQTDRSWFMGVSPSLQPVTLTINLQIPERPDIDPKLTMDPYIKIYASGVSGEAQFFELTNFFNIQNSAVSFYGYMELTTSSPTLCLVPQNYNNRYLSYQDAIKVPIPTLPYGLDTFIVQYAARQAEGHKNQTTADMMTWENPATSQGFLGSFSRGAGMVADAVFNGPSAWGNLRERQQDRMRARSTGEASGFFSSLESQETAVNRNQTQASFNSAYNRTPVTDILDGSANYPEYAAWLNRRAHATPNNHWNDGDGSTFMQVGVMGPMIGLRVLTNYLAKEHTDYFKWYGYNRGLIKKPVVATPATMYDPGEGSYCHTSSCRITNVPTDAQLFIETMFDRGVRMKMLA